MKARVGIVDLGVAAVVLVAIFLPSRAFTISKLIPVPKRSELLVAQSDLASASGTERAARGAEIASRILTDAGQHDLAVRMASPTASAAAPETWRANLGAALALAARLEIPRAFAQASDALSKCEKAESTCLVHERTRLELLLGQLDAGVKALESGLDPKTQPTAFRKKIQELNPTVQFRISPGR